MKCRGLKPVEVENVKERKKNGREIRNKTFLKSRRVSEPVHVVSLHRNVLSQLIAKTYWHFVDGANTTCYIRHFGASKKKKKKKSHQLCEKVCTCMCVCKGPYYIGFRPIAGHQNSSSFENLLFQPLPHFLFRKAKQESNYDLSYLTCRSSVHSCWGAYSDKERFVNWIFCM